MKTQTARRRPVTLRGVSYPSITTALSAVSVEVTDTFLLSKTRSEQVKIISFRLIAGWLDEQAFGLLPPPEWAGKSKPHPIACNGKVFPSEKALARAHGIQYKVLHQRLHRDRWPPEAAVEIEPPPRLLTVRGDVTGCIYVWERIETGKRYVGQTIDRARRRWQHLFAARMGGHAEGTIHGDLKKFGVAAFRFFIAEENIPAQDLPNRERHWIASLGTKAPIGYNQNAGGVFGGFAQAMYIAGTRYESLRHAAQTFDMHPGRLLGRMQLGWSAEEAVGLKIRKPKTRTPLTLDFDGGSGKIEFSTIAEARRHFGYEYRDIENIRKRRRMSWAEAIRIAFINQLTMDVPDNPDPWPWASRRQRLAGG